MDVDVDECMQVKRQIVSNNEIGKAWFVILPNQK